MLRRIGVLASLAVIAAMFAGGSSAQAATAGVCVFEGLAGNLNPGIQDAVPDVLSAPVGPLDYEQGTYHYGGDTGVCAGVFNNAPQVSPATSITSDGEYDNILCGTGFAHDVDGSGTVISGNGISIGPNAAGYQIPFVGGVGPLLIGPNGAPNLSRVAGAPDTGTAEDGNISSSYVGAGLVQITPGNDADAPTARDNCLLSPDGKTDSFQVKGFFVAAGL